MKVGILDTKVNGQPIDNVELYKAKGYEIINSGHLDRGAKFDIVATTWTRLNEKRLKAAAIKGVVVKDNDEPGNVLDVDLVARLGIPYNLIGLWGIETRVQWNLKQIESFFGSKELRGVKVVMIANTPSHDALQNELMKRGAAVTYPVLPSTHDHQLVEGYVIGADVIIVHLGKDDFHRYWLDTFLPKFPNHSLFISTTRGPLYSATALNKTIGHGTTAVLDWAWEEDKLLKSSRVIHTGHTSYRSEQSGVELSKEVIKAVEKMKRKLSR